MYNRIHLTHPSCSFCIFLLQHTTHSFSPYNKQQMPAYTTDATSTSAFHCYAFFHHKCQYLNCKTSQLFKCTTFIAHFLYPAQLFGMPGH
ncbi:hypothetical protein Hanom_Chr16g01483361 [Helianthus anomalus]